MSEAVNDTVQVERDPEAKPNSNHIRKVIARKLSLCELFGIEFCALFGIIGLSFEAYRQICASNEGYVFFTTRFVTRN